MGYVFYGMESKIVKSMVISTNPDNLKNLSSLPIELKGPLMIQLTKEWGDRAPEAKILRVFMDPPIKGLKKVSDNLRMKEVDRFHRREYKFLEIQRIHGDIATASLRKGLDNLVELGYLQMYEGGKGKSQTKYWKLSNDPEFVTYIIHRARFAAKSYSEGVSKF